MRTILTTAALAFLLGAGGATGQVDEGMTATATLINPDGEEIGDVTLTQTPNHGVLVRVTVDGLEPGTHGLHIHETGACEVPSFDSAGGHYAPRGHAHGVLHPHGKHAGDLLNLEVPENGRVVTERLAEGVTLTPGVHASLFDDDGSAIVIHATGDDYHTQPSGEGGPKVGCGVVH